MLDFFGMFRKEERPQQWRGTANRFCGVAAKFLRPKWSAEADLYGETRKVVFTYHGPNDCTVSFVEEMPESIAGKELDEKIGAVRDRMLWAEKSLNSKAERLAWLLKEEE